MSLEFVYTPRRSETNVSFEATKRVFDLLAACTLLAVLTPVFVIIAILIRRNSPGPILFRQIRVGKDGQEFRIFKFRTMRAGADRSGPQITSEDDNRITPLGKRLRSLKLDELPQLFNVINGDMSMVGPRPQVPKFVDKFDPAYRSIVLAVRPGITGPTQLKFRHEEALLKGKEDREQFYIEEVLPVKCALDVEYVQRRSLGLDIGVLMTTCTLLGAATFRRVGRNRVDSAEDLRVNEEFREAVVIADQIREECSRSEHAIR